MDVEKLKASIQKHEGKGPVRNGRFYPYKDSRGLITIGYGRCLDKEGLSQDETNMLLSSDIQSAIGAATAQIWWPAVSDNDARSRAMVEIIYNMGIGGVSGFHDALAAMERSDWPAAAAGFLDSLWSQQVGQRAEVLAAMILNGSD